MTFLLFMLTLITSYLSTAANHTCITPDGVHGTCLGLYSCPHLLDKLKKNTTHAIIQYVQESSCDGPEQYNVCCTSQSNTEPASPLGPSLSQKCQLTAFPPEPSTKCCGLDAGGGGNRITGGTETAVDEYPWMALIEYKKYNITRLLCGGVLVSGRYVLTAAHCIAGSTLNNGIPVKVRLGEYDSSNDGPDCIKVEGGGQDCTDGAESIPIKEIIPYPYYNSSSPKRRNDIALLRLIRTVKYTEFIRPICLPTVDFTTTPPGEVTLHAAGWGAVSSTQGSSDIKRKVSLPYLSYQDCQPWYAIPARRVKLWGGQICAGGVPGKDTCNGDSGGPLMRKIGKLFEVVGIVSFGPSCGTENAPGVYTKVSMYLPWINRVIQLNK